MNQIHFLRAYWSDIILVESNGLYAMIDTGYDRDAERIITYLEEIGVRRLEFILITHFHRDHYGSLPALLKRYPVGKVYMKRFSGINRTDSSGRPATEESNRREMELCESMCQLAETVSELVVIDENVTHVVVGDFDLQLFGTTDAVREMYEAEDSPYRGQVCFGENPNSVALFCQVEGVSIYLGGDANNNSLEYPKYDRVNEQYAHAVGRPIEIYKVPHHCCGSIFSEDLLEIFKPRYSVVTNWWMTVCRNFGANVEMLRRSAPEGHILFTDVCGYRFTIDEGAVSYHKITVLPEIIIEGTLSETDCQQVHFFREGLCIGEASYSLYENGTCRILDFQVYPEFRGMGTGHYCYYALEKALYQGGARRLEMQIDPSFARGFWTAFGYQEEAPGVWSVALPAGGACY